MTDVGPDLICTECGEPIRGATYGRLNGGAVHVDCWFPEPCPACHQDLWADGLLLMAGEFWHLGCLAPAETPRAVGPPLTPPPAPGRRKPSFS